MQITDAGDVMGEWTTNRLAAPRTAPAIDALGRVSLIGQSYSTDEGILLAEFEGGDFTLEEIPGTTDAHDHGLWKDDDGTLSIVLSDPEGERRLSRDLEGSWGEEVFDAPWPGNFFDAAVTADGESTLWRKLGDGLVAWRETSQEIAEFGSFALGTPARGLYSLLTPARPRGSSSKEGLLAIRSGTGVLGIASLEGLDAVEFDIPSAPLADFVCEPVQSESECLGGCEETAEGVEGNLMGLAQTQDDRIWAAWIHSRMDQSICWSWREVVEPEGTGGCSGNLTRDDSWAELVIAEVDLASRSVAERLRTPVGRPRTEWITTDYKTVPSLAIASYGNRLALSFGEQGSWPALRVMVIDTSAL